jgi:hypothetical protein
MDAVRNLKANLKLENKPCGWCQTGLQIGEDASVCTSCEKEHHQRCWDNKAGCSTAGCVNAPLQRLDAPARPGVPAVAALAPGSMYCPNCRTVIAIGSDLCPLCRAVTSPDGIYHGPRFNAPGAAAALTFGIIGLFICGVIFGPLAISKANSAKRMMAQDPTLTGGGMATAGLVLGIIDLVFWAIFMLIRFGTMR